MANVKVLGMGLGTLVVVLLFVLPLTIVRGLIGKVFAPAAGILEKLGFVARMIPYVKKFY